MALEIAAKIRLRFELKQNFVLFFTQMHFDSGRLISFVAFWLFSCYQTFVKFVRFRQDLKRTRVTTI